MSISSSEGSPLPTDLTTKYQKLAAEYAKVRANVGVLKKAVLDEQTRSTELKEAIKAKDQTLRKHDQELDSLVFRNQQLTKRVMFLQEELDRVQDLSKKGRPKLEGGVTAEESKLFQEELQTRIIENAKLLSQLDEKEQELERERRQWQKNKEAYETQLQEAQSSVLNMRLSNNQQHSALVTDKTESKTSPWKTIQNLPFSILFTPLESLMTNETHIEAVRSLQKLLKISSKELVVAGLHDYLNQLASQINRIEAMNPMVCEFLRVLKKLAGEMLECFDSSVPFQLTPLSAVVEQCNALTKKYVTPDADSKVLNSLIELQNGCERFQRTLAEFASSELRQLTRLNCHEEIEHFEKRISTDCSLTNGPSTVIAAAVSEPRLKTVLNEFGAGTTIEEPVWVEEAVKNHIRVMTNALATDRQAAESKLTAVLKECDAMKSRLAHFSEETRRKNQELANVQEELSVTSRNYEEQLSSMSEHMANMNDKLAAQEATIEELTYELNKKDSKKSRSK